MHVRYCKKKQTKNIYNKVRTECTLVPVNNFSRIKSPLHMFKPTLNIYMHLLRLLLNIFAFCITTGELYYYMSQ